MKLVIGFLVGLMLGVTIKEPKQHRMTVILPNKHTLSCTQYVFENGEVCGRGCMEYNESLDQIDPYKKDFCHERFTVVP